MEYGPIIRGQNSALMRTSLFISLTLLALTVLSTPVASGQSLADVAARTERDRKAGNPTRTYGNGDLKPVRETVPAATDIVLPAATGPGGPGGDLSREDIARAVMPAVVTIETGTATGTGFFVNVDTLLTNKHVVGNTTSVRLRYAGGASGTGYVTSAASDADLALVHVDQPPAGHPTLRLAPSRSVQVGEEVLAIGSALGLLQGTVTRGIVSAVRTAGGLTMVQTDAAINPGNSGGPLINRTGAVVGITTARMNGAESLGFAIATDHASALLGGSITVLRRDDGVSDGNGLSGFADTGGKSDTDELRERGQEQFERAVQALARAADDVDVAWKQYRAACVGKYTVGTIVNGREWFGLYGDSVLLSNETMPECRARREALGRVANDIGDGMRQAEESARRAGVFPGTTRTIRAKYAMDWPGWEK